MSVAIRTEKLTKRFGDVAALVDLDLEVNAGEVFGYLGPNGAGKSTTIGLLLGFLRPTSGRAEIFGSETGTNSRELHGRMAYVPSGVDLWPTLTGAETMSFLASIHGSVDEAYRGELTERFHLDPDRKLRALSHGNRQKVVLIAALASRADLLLLDEPTSGLDPLMERVFQECVREASARGQTVFLSSHILSEVEAVCERVAMLSGGRLIEVGALESMRDVAAVRVEIEVAGEAPHLDGVPGVEQVEVHGPTVHCLVTGSMAPLMQALAAVSVEKLVTHEPTLEELFLTRYRRPLDPVADR